MAAFASAGLESVALRSSNRVCPEGLFLLAKARQLYRARREGREGPERLFDQQEWMIRVLQFLRRIRYASASTLAGSHFHIGHRPRRPYSGRAGEERGAAA